MTSAILTIIIIPVILIFGLLLVRFAVKLLLFLLAFIYKLVSVLGSGSPTPDLKQALLDLFSDHLGIRRFMELSNLKYRLTRFLSYLTPRRIHMASTETANPPDVPATKKTAPPNKKKRNFLPYLIGIALVFIVFISMISRFFTTIPAGHVGVGSLFGKVQTDIYTEGFHLKNPLVTITLFDARQKTHKEEMGVPSSDQLITKFDLSIQYRLIKEQAPVMLKETGTPKEVLDVHMMPLLRSLMREIGKSVPQAENFYEQAVQQRIQEELLTGLSGLAQKGIKIEKLLIREVTLPTIITDAVMRKKEAAQAAEKAKEELKKFKVDQERKEAQAEAEKRAELIEANKKKEVMLIGANAQLEAARIEAQSVLVRAEAEALAKKKIIDAITLEGYVKLESMKVLKELQNGNHLIIVDPNAATPLPFLNLDQIRNPKPRAQ